MKSNRNAAVSGRGVARGACVAALAAAIGLGAADARAQSAPGWVETWGASPQQPIDPVVGGTPITLNNQTIRQVVRISAGATTLRLRLSNEYTNAPTTVGDVHIAVAASPDSASGAIVPGTDQVVTFGGSTSITLAPNAPVLSDPISMPVDRLTSLSISIYVSGATAPTTVHSLGQQTAYIASGDVAGAADLTSGSTTTQARYLLSGVDAYLPSGGATLVTFGDSITDGYHSTPDQDHRWPDFLSERLQARASLRSVAIADEGISGNRLLSEGIGPNAQSRFDRDALSRPGVRYVILLEGINDIGFPVVFPGSAAVMSADLIAADLQLIARAHERGVLIYGATLTPFEGAGYYSSAGEATREAFNKWIRTSGAFDGVIDFDKATRDPSNPHQFLPAYDSGDHLHPNDAGYAAMANAVPLALLTR
jgi:lysophospholipase L1-like esterase